VARGVSIPVFGSGDCVAPEQAVDRLLKGSARGVLVGRGALRNPWIFSQAQALLSGEQLSETSMRERGQFLLDYLELLLNERVGEAAGFRHVAPGVPVPARGRERWVINKLRALGSWYTKGFENGSHLRVAINSSESIGQLRDIIEGFFFTPQPRTSETFEASVSS
jgi:tRNA-dihydrouridine synthase B